MNTLSVMLMSVVATFVTPSVVSAGSARLVIDTTSNGNYWWGSAWEHLPHDADTTDCVCMMGKSLRGQDVVDCVANGISRGKGLGFTATGWDSTKPIEIATFGSDALWINRVQWNGQWIGHNDAGGECMSKDAGDTYFDKWAIVPRRRCFQTWTFYPRGTRYAGQLLGAHRFGNLYRHMESRARNVCRSRGRSVRRRVEEPLVDSEELDNAAGLTMQNIQFIDDSEELENTAEELENTGVHSPDTRAHLALRDRLVNLVSERDSIKPDELDQILDDVMLDVEHEEEREAHDGETVEEESLDADAIAEGPEEDMSTGFTAPHPPAAVADELENTGVHSEDPPAHKALRDTLVKLVSERDSITADELDEILENVMLKVAREEESDEGLEEDIFEGVLPGSLDIKF